MLPEEEFKNASETEIDDRGYRTARNVLKSRYESANRTHFFCSFLFFSKLWPNNTIPYVVNSQFGAYSRALIARAMSEFHAKTCITFVPRDEQLHPGLSIPILSHYHKNQTDG